MALRWVRSFRATAMMMALKGLWGVVSFSRNSMRTGSRLLAMKAAR